MAHGRNRVDLVSIVESAYRIEQSTEAWLSGILAAAAPAIDHGLGVAAFSYDASDPSNFRLGVVSHQGFADGLAIPFVESFAQMDRDYVSLSFRTLSCGTASEVPGWHRLPFVGLLAERFGVRDSLTVNGVNPDGQGCAVLAPAAAELKLGSRRRNLFSKVSCHLGAAVRLRQRLASASAESPEAVLDCTGKVLHAEGDARSKSAISDLQESAVAMGKARGALRVRDPEQAVDEWKGLIAARWTLLDISESDGRKYLVARQNQPRIRGPGALTEREQQVAALAVMQQHNKLIAYNLGISHATVRVLMARAAAKLGASSRADLVRKLRDGTQ